MPQILKILIVIFPCQSRSAGGRLSRLSDVSILAEIILSNGEDDDDDDKENDEGIIYRSGGSIIQISNIENRNGKKAKDGRIRQV